MDEHRVGLKPILRRVWAPKGTRPIAVVHPQYEWFYVYAFLHPPSGEVHWLLLPRVDADTFTVALAEFARLVGAGPEHRILLVLDGAGWHASGTVEVPEGIELVFLPAASPELQPAERLWPLTNEAIANRTFESLDELDQVVGDRCVILSATPELIRSYTLYHWWPQSA
jgi:transposase